MKTSEDKLNEALRGVLKRKFDDYEEQPAPNALDRIRARVKPSGNNRLWWTGGAFMLLILSGLMWMRDTTKYVGPSSGHALANTSAKAGPFASAGSRKRANTMAAKPETLSAISDKPADRAFVSIVPKNLAGSGASGSHSSQPVAVKMREELPVALREPGNAGLIQRADGGPSTDVVALPEHETQAVADSAVDGSVLEELEGITWKEARIPLHGRAVAAPHYPPSKAIVTTPSKTAWLFNALALHSYQILTVPSFAAQDFQNFSFPGLFTAASMGMKFSGGIERKGVQVLLHYSAFKQTYSYEIANNNYLVKPDDKGQYQTVRQGDRMEENRKFSMLGIGVSRQLRWGHSPVSRFYAGLGAEYSHDLNSRQGLGWINLGLGKLFFVTRTTAFSIGPYAEFSPVKVKGTDNPFYYQPYRVGISAGFRFVRP